MCDFSCSDYFNSNTFRFACRCLQTVISIFIAISILGYSSMQLSLVGREIYGSLSEVYNSYECIGIPTRSVLLCTYCNFVQQIVDQTSIMLLV